jgi:hypothetical protein
VAGRRPGSRYARVAPGVLAAICRTLLCRITPASHAARVGSLDTAQGWRCAPCIGVPTPEQDRMPGTKRTPGGVPYHFLVPLLNAVRLDDPWLPRLWEDEVGATSNPRCARDGKEEEIPLGVPVQS